MSPSSCSSNLSFNSHSSLSFSLSLTLSLSTVPYKDDAPAHSPALCHAPASESDPIGLNHPAGRVLAPARQLNPPEIARPPARTPDVDLYVASLLLLSTWSGWSTHPLLTFRAFTLPSPASALKPISISYNTASNTADDGPPRPTSRPLLRADSHLQSCFKREDDPELYALWVGK